MTTDTVAFIFVRGGSKGLPGKNLRPLAGKPLLAHAVEQARAARGVDRVVVSTDDPELARIAAERGAEVPFMRPPELAADDTPEWLAWQHALQALAGEVGTFVSVPATAPLRQPGDIDACIERFLEGGVDVVLTVTQARRSPWFNMVTLDAEGCARLVIPPSEAIHRRQDVPAVYDLTTVCYVADPAFVLRAHGLFDGRAGVVQVPAERALDIDTETDFRIAEALLGRSGED